MTKRHKPCAMYFDYTLEMHEKLYVCIVEDDLVTGISENSFEEAISDAKQKLYYHIGLTCKGKHGTEAIRIDYDDYITFHKNQLEHILL